jgi:signal transduction histidine kinase
MTRPRQPTANDPRIEGILELLVQLAGGNLEVQLAHSGEGDALDAIIESINMLAEELRASREELQRAHERILRQEKLTLMGQLCGGVAHELRNPLGALKNAAYFLQMALEAPEPEVKETLEIVENEVHTCESIIGNLLDFARPKLATHVKLEINGLLEQLLAKASLPPGIEVVRRLAPDLPRILADPGQLAQAFGNIVQNAIQAMSEGAGTGRLELATSAVDGAGLEVSISDTGVGIPKDQLHRVFEPLFTTKAKGIGLGLAVTRTVIDNHGGSIEVRSEPGRGTTFTVRLPTRPEGGTHHG